MVEVAEDSVQNAGCALDGGQQDSTRRLRRVAAAADAVTRGPAHDEKSAVREGRVQLVPTAG